jgi:hypothetical protein
MGRRPGINMAQTAEQAAVFRWKGTPLRVADTALNCLCHSA